MRASRALPACKDNKLHPSHISAHGLLERGGYLQALGRGIFSMLPLGMQVMTMVSGHIHREMAELGGHEVLLPLLSPDTIWRETGRLKLAQGEVLRVNSSTGDGLILSPSHEQAAMLLFKNIIRHQSQLPAFIFQTQTKTRDDKSKNPGLESAREFLMHDGYSLHPSFASLNNFIPRVYKAYKTIFHSLGIEPIIADGVANHMGGDRSYDFFITHPAGDYGLVHCSNCGYVANQDVASGSLAIDREKPLPMQTMVRLDLGTMDELLLELGIPHQRMARARLYWGFSHAILAVYRSDQEPSIDKISRLCGDTIIREATSAEILRHGLDPQHLSPLGLRNRRLEQKGLLVVVDRLVAESSNLILPVNEEHSYVINANFGRDYDADLSGDICRITPDFRCRTCDSTLELSRALKMANIMRLGEYYSQAMGFKVQNETGGESFPSLGAYGINLGRVLLALVESNRSSRGFLWPLSFSPYRASLVYLGLTNRLKDLADRIYQENNDLLLYEDGNDGVLSKCKRADALGIKLRLVLTRASLADNKIDVVNAEKKTRHRLSINQIRPYIMEQSRADQLP